MVDLTYFNFQKGTSACPDGHFWCENKEYKGIQIFSSHVGDGICGKENFIFIEEFNFQSFYF